MNAPIDQTHADSLLAIETIRREIAALHAQVAQWEPRPIPLGWLTGKTR
jgi:hypothetical protein